MMSSVRREREPGFLLVSSSGPRSGPSPPPQPARPAWPGRGPPLVLLPLTKQARVRLRAQPRQTGAAGERRGLDGGCPG